jgi:O-antigen/teichoic acid export membrane protein
MGIILAKSRKALQLLFELSLISDVFKVGIVYLLAMIAMFFSDILFARHLDQYDYGVYTFVRQSVVLIISLAFLGIDGSIVRIISRKSLAHFKWKIFLRTWIIGFVLSSLLFSMLIAIFYKQSLGSFITIWISSLFGCIALLEAALLRANFSYGIAQLATHFWKLFLIVPALITFRSLNLNVTFLLVSIGYILSAVLPIRSLFRHESGDEVIDGKLVIGEGVLFWVNSGVLTLTSLADQFVITKILGYSLLAQYSAAWNIIGFFFIFTMTSINFVVVPKLIKDKQYISLQKKFILIGLLLLLLVSMLIYYFSPSIVKVAYFGKYQISAALTFLFVSIGTIRLIYAIPSAIITAWGKTKDIGYYSFAGIFGVALNLGVALLLIPVLGINGAAVGSLAGWIFRMLLGTIISLKIISRNKEESLALA